MTGEHVELCNPAETRVIDHFLSFTAVSVALSSRAVLDGAGESFLSVHACVGACEVQASEDGDYVADLLFLPLAQAIR